KSEEDGDDQDSLNQDVGEVELIIEKNRAGARGTVKLLFIKSYNKFSNISYAQEPPM
ncbi:replicative DNA helicase, partial [Lactobacillus salivarius]|nr:replicative DNA helicase [Ligilactobacillus salivarius]